MSSIASAMAGMAEGKKRPGITEHVDQHAQEGESEGKGHTIHPHGDGSFHSIGADGEKTEHPTAGHAATHFLAKHGEEGQHVHAHSDGMEHTTHHTTGGGNGKVEGPHSHENIEALKDHVGKFLGEEEQEGADGGGYGRVSGR